MTAPRPRLGIVVASVREGRRGGAIGHWTAERAAAHGAFEVELIDLEAIDLPLMTEPNHPRLKSYVQPYTRAWSAKVEATDAFVFVTPEYNHGLTAPLKNAIDYLHQEWLYKPVGFVSYGGIAAGTRAVQMLKQVLAALRMVPVFPGVAIRDVSLLLPTGADRIPADEAREAAAAAMLDELLRVHLATVSLRDE
ncbi:MAG TPA: NAD(P)H-dependent oxidoreductase [Solirubrobacterales bacterium]|nr:NAD(P)H-dependent oxidoreductase [Solirubrobacterales bacterium]